MNTRNPLNIGAAARAMSNFGFSNLRVVNPYELAFREARSAVGASVVLASAEEYKSVADAVADCTLVVGTTAVGSRQLQHRVRRLEQGAAVIRRRLAGSPAALLFGSEKRGLSNEDLSHCHWLLRVPTRAEHRSMNLGQAVAICLYEIARDSKVVQQTERAVAAASADVERITMVVLDALLASGYLKSAPRGTPEDETDSKTESRPAQTPDRSLTHVHVERIRRLIRRLRLSATDAELLLGILRQILWRIQSRQGH